MSSEELDISASIPLVPLYTFLANSFVAIGISLKVTFVLGGVYLLFMAVVTQIIHQPKQSKTNRNITQNYRSVDSIKEALRARDYRH